MRTGPAIVVAALALAVGACSSSSRATATGGATRPSGPVTTASEAATTTVPAPTTAAPPSTTGAPPSTAVPAPATTVDVAAGLADLGLVGTWYHHGLDLTIRPDGSGTANWRMYRTCSEGPPPCDQIVGNEILDGGHATFSVRPVAQSSVAIATMASSTDPTLLGARGTVQITPILGRKGPGREVLFPTLRDPNFVLCDAAALVTGDCGA